MRRIRLAVCCIGLLCIGLESPAGAIGAPQVTGSVTTNLDIPWGIAPMPWRGALVSERGTAEIVRVMPDGDQIVAGTVPGVVATGEAGLLGIALSPTFAGDRLVYAYFTTATDNRIVRMPYVDGALGEPQLVFSGIPAWSSHDGGRIAFGTDGMLYVGTGDAGDPNSAQDLSSLGGKILRMTPDGGPAPGNPIDGSVVYSWGHRNVQGLAFDAQGRLWASEFGQDTWDELNLIQAGGNYGWPIVEGEGNQGGYIDPLVQWSTSIASPSGIAIVDGVVWMAALRGERLWAIPIAGDGVGTPQEFFTGEFGRLRALTLAPDGSMWVLTNNTDGRGDPGPGDDRILRMAPSG